MMKRALFTAALLLALSAPQAGAVQWANESHTFANLSATPATFKLFGGQYSVTVHAGTWNSGSVTLQRQAADGATMVTCLTAFSADGYATANLPAGTYQLTIATATGVYADVTSVIANK